MHIDIFLSRTILILKMFCEKLKKPIVDDILSVNQSTLVKNEFILLFVE